MKLASTKYIVFELKAFFFQVCCIQKYVGVDCIFFFNCFFQYFIHTLSFSKNWACGQSNERCIFVKSISHIYLRECFNRNCVNAFYFSVVLYNWCSVIEVGNCAFFFGYETKPSRHADEIKLQSNIFPFSSSSGWICIIKMTHFPLISLLTNESKTNYWVLHQYSIAVY